MAFIKDQTGVAQTAANASATLVSAFVDKFDTFKDAVSAFDKLRVSLFEDLAAIVDADNEKFAAAWEGSSNGSSKSSNGSSKSSNRSTKTAGGSKTRSSSGGRKSGGGSSITLDDSLGMVLNFGAFEGETLGDLLKIDTASAEDDYSYGDGERDGRDYISWLASDRNQNEFVQKRARLIADDEDISY